MANATHQESDRNVLPEAELILTHPLPKRTDTFATLIFKQTYDIDLKSLNILISSVGWPERSEEAWNKLLNDSKIVLTAWQAGELIGLARILGEGSSGNVTDVVVRADLHGLGYGKALIKELIETAKIAGYSNLNGSVFEQKDSLFKFYAKCGFVRTGNTLLSLAL